MQAGPKPHEHELCSSRQLMLVSQPYSSVNSDRPRCPSSSALFSGRAMAEICRDTFFGSLPTCAETVSCSAIPAASSGVCSILGRTFEMQSALQCDWEDHPKAISKRSIAGIELEVSCLLSGRALWNFSLLILSSPCSKRRLLIRLHIRRTAAGAGPWKSMMSRPLSS